MAQSHEPADFERAFGALLDEVAGLFDLLGLPYMLIGGLAVAVRAEARATKDIDLSVLVDVEAAERLVREMATRGFQAHVHGPLGPGAVVRFRRIDKDGILRWVDVLCSGTDLEEQALARASRERLLGREIPVATVEDLIIFKLVAGRLQDYADTERLLAAARGRLDDAYLQARAEEWEVAEVLARVRAGRLIP
jgi:hypothetical protein